MRPDEENSEDALLIGPKNNVTTYFLQIKIPSLDVIKIIILGNVDNWLKILIHFNFIFFVMSISCTLEYDDWKLRVM